MVGSSARLVPMKPFMSQVPRPYSRPSRITGLNGSVVQFWPSTGTTSVWPDSTMPPSVAPLAAGTVTNRLALSPAGL